MVMEVNNTDDSSNASSLFISISSICLLIVEVLGILCNSMILAIYYKYSRLRTATNLFIFNLALCNLLLATLEIIFSLPSSFNKEWLYESVGCLAYGFGHHYLMSVAVCTLSVISFDRFCVITKPVVNLRTFGVTKKHAGMLIAFVHVYSLAFTFPPLVGWNELVPDDHFQTGCYINFADQSAGSVTYTILSTVFICILPFILTAFCYARIYRSVRNSSKRSTLRNRTLQKTVTGGSVDRKNSRRRSISHTRTARMIVVILFFFLLIWLPYKITGLCQAFGVNVTVLVVYISVLLAKSCVMYNAVVYVFLNHRFRAAFLHLTFIFRKETRLRITTSMPNQSGRFCEIAPTVINPNKGSSILLLTGNNPSHLSTSPTDYNAETSSVKISTELPADDCTRLQGLVAQDLGGHPRVNEEFYLPTDVVYRRIPSINGPCVSEVSEAEESDAKSTNKPKSTEIRIEELENESLEKINRSDTRDISREGESPEIASGTFCQENNLVLSDEETSVEKFLELNVDSLYKQAPL